MAKSKTYGLVIELSADTSATIAAIAQIDKEIATTRSAIGTLERALKFDPGNMTLLSEQARLLTKEYELQADRVSELRKEQEAMQKAFANQEINEQQWAQYNAELVISQSKLEKVRESLIDTQRAMDVAGNESKDFGKEFSNSLDDVESAIRKASAEAVDFGDILKANLASELIIDGVRNLTSAVKDMFVSAVDSSLSFETAFAGVEKTVNASEAEFAQMEASIRSMAKEIPASAAEISNVAEAAGQLGIQQKSIVEFSRSMIDLGESTNLSATEAASSLAQFANVSQMSQDDFDRLGSTIVALGNNFATTEADIVAMAQRLVGTGSQVGATESQIVAMAAALSSVGVEAEAGGTAVSKTLGEIQLAVETNSGALEQFASVAGMTSEQFKQAFNTDAVAAFDAFVQGLGAAEDAGQSAIAVLDNMGIVEARQRDTLLRLAGASDILTQAVELGNSAWTENTALTNEANKRYETMESQFAIFKNEVTDLGIQIGDRVMPAIENAMDKTVEMLAENEDNIVAFVEAVANLFTYIIDNSDTVVAGLAGVGTAIAAWKVGNTVSALVTAIKGIGTAASTASGLVGTFGTTLSTALGPVGLIAGAVGLLTAAIIGIAQEVENAKNMQLEYNEALERYNDIQSQGIQSSDISRYTQEIEELEQLRSQYVLLSETANLLIPSTRETQQAFMELGEAEKMTGINALELLESLNKFGIELEDIDRKGIATGESVSYIDNRIRLLTDAVEVAAIDLTAYAGVLSETQKEQIQGDIEIVQSAQKRAEEQKKANEKIIESLEAETAALDENDKQIAENNITISELKEKNEEIDSSIVQYTDTIYGLNNALEQSTELTIEATKSQEAQTVSTENNRKSTEELISEIDAYRSAAGTLDSAIETLREGQFLEKDALQQLINTYPEVAAYIAETGDLTLQNGKIVEQVSEVKRQSVISDLESEIAKTQNEISQAKIRVENARDEYEDKAAIAAAYYKKMGEIDTSSIEFEDAIEAREAMKAAEEESAVLDAQLAGLQATIKNLATSTGSAFSSVSSGVSSGGSAATQATEETIDALEEEIKAFEHLQKIGQKTKQDELAWVQDVLSREELASDDRMEFTEREYALKKELSDDSIDLQLAQYEEESRIKERSHADDLAFIDDLLAAEELTEEKRNDLLTQRQEIVDAQNEKNLDETERFGDLVTEALEKSYEAQYESQKSSLEAQLSLLEDITYDEVTVTRDGSEERIEIISDEYTERLSEYDADKAAYLEASNAKIESEIELIGILDEQRAADLQAHYDKLAEIQAEEDAARAAIDARREDEEQAELEKRVQEAETVEARKEAETELQEFLDALNREKEREKVNADIDAINEAYDAEIKKANELIDKEKELQDASINAGLNFDEQTIAADLDKLNQMYSEQLAQIPQEAADLILGDQAKAFALLNEQLPNWHEQGKSTIEFFNEGVADLTPEMVENMKQTGADAGDGFLVGLQETEPEIMAAAQSIANSVRATIQSALQIASPSKALRQDGKNTGIGYALGIRDTIGQVRGEAEKVADAARGGMKQTAKGDTGTSNTQNVEFQFYYNGSGTTSDADMRKFMQKMAMYARKSMASEGVVRA